MNRTIRSAAVGFFLAGGAPLGWLLIRMSEGATVAVEIRTHAGLYLYLWIGTSVFFAAFGAVLGRLADRLDAAALVDRLTGLKNLRYFEARFREESARSAREGRKLALIMADLDHFKKVNDTYGHPIGDLVLAATGHAILASIRAGDSACRVGGEEFAILCPDTETPEATAIAERIRTAVAAIKIPALQLTITISLGIAFQPPCPGENLVKRADEALYQAKRGGRNRVQISPQDPAAAASPEGRPQTP